MPKMEKKGSTRPWNKPSRSRESAENYLRTILEIRSSHGRCRNVDIARHLGVPRASVSKALVKLSEAGFVEVVDHDVDFTPEGRAIAEATSARHRFFEGRCAKPGSPSTKHPEMPAAWSAASPPILSRSSIPI